MKSRFKVQGSRFKVQGSSSSTSRLPAFAVKKPHRKTETFYAIQLLSHKHPRKPRLASGIQGPLGFWRYSKARNVLKYFREHFPEAKIVKVTATLRWLLPFVIGYWLLAIGCSESPAQDLPPLPKSIPATPRLYYFSLLTCSKIGTNVYADWSNEVIVTNQQLHTWTGTWNPDPDALFYTLCQGRQSRHYTNCIDTTGTIATIVVAPFSPTNRILTITSSGATNLQYRPWGGTWMFTGWTNRTLTNPPIGNQYRAVGRKPSTPQISITINQ